MVGVGVVEAADHHVCKGLVLAVVHENELSSEDIFLKHHFVHHFSIN